MKTPFLYSKLHRATVTGADMDYEGSIAIDPKLCDAARFRKFQKVEIYNINNGERFQTYVIYGGPGEICLNGAAARLVHRGDKVIICAYTELEESEIKDFKPRVVLLGEQNEIKEMYDSSIF